MCGTPKSKAITAKPDFKEDDENIFDGIEELITPVVPDEATRNRIVKLEIELASARSSIERLVKMLNFISRTKKQANKGNCKEKQREKHQSPFNVHIFLCVLLGVLTIETSLCLFTSRSNQAHNSSLPDSPVSAFDCDQTPAREVKFMHLNDYSYDFAMVGGFVSEISGKSEKAGLKIGDEILSVNGVDVREKAAEVIYNLIWKTDVPSGKEESRFARHDWEKPLTLIVRRNLVGFERLQAATAKSSKISLYCGICLGAVLFLFIAAILRALPFCK